MVPADFTSDALASGPENVISNVDVVNSNDINCVIPQFESSDVAMCGGIDMTGPVFKSRDVFASGGVLESGPEVVSSNIFEMAGINYKVPEFLPFGPDIAQSGSGYSQETENDTGKILYQDKRNRSIQQEVDYELMPDAVVISDKKVKDEHNHHDMRDVVAKIEPESSTCRGYIIHFMIIIIYI